LITLAYGNLNKLSLLGSNIPKDKLCNLFAEPIKKFYLDLYHLKEDYDYASNKTMILPFFVGQQESIFISIH